MSEVPDNWNTVDFDDSAWEYALEWDEEVVGWSLRPTGCSDPNTYISPDVDPDGNNLICPSQLDWGEAEFIWRDDLVLDNTIHCRYTVKAEGGAVPTTATTLIFSISSLVAVIFTGP